MGDPNCPLPEPELEPSLALILQSVIDLDMAVADRQASSQRMEVGHHRVMRTLAGQG